MFKETPNYNAFHYFLPIFQLKIFGKRRYNGKKNDLVIYVPKGLFEPYLKKGVENTVKSEAVCPVNLEDVLAETEQHR